jgi:hypothetical protein
MSRCPVPFSTAYKHLKDMCVPGNNIDNRHYVGKTVNECAKMCDDKSKCVAFEYGNGRTPGSPWKKGYCILNSNTKLGTTAYCKKLGADVYINRAYTYDW